jgi:hypothetical protein
MAVLVEGANRPVPERLWSGRVAKLLSFERLLVR